MRKKIRNVNNKLEFAFAFRNVEHGTNLPKHRSTVAQILYLDQDGKFSSLFASLKRVKPQVSGGHDRESL
jgi:hypothetical protein